MSGPSSSPTCPDWDTHPTSGDRKPCGRFGTSWFQQTLSEVEAA